MDKRQLDTTRYRMSGSYRSDVGSDSSDRNNPLAYPPSTPPSFPAAKKCACNRSDRVLELEQLLPPPDNGGEDGGAGGGGAAIAFAVLRAMGTTISEVENASLRLKPLVLSHAFTSPEELVQTLVAHYRGQASPVVEAV